MTEKCQSVEVAQMDAWFPVGRHLGKPLGGGWEGGARIFLVGRLRTHPPQVLPFCPGDLSHY